MENAETEKKPCDRSVLAASLIVIFNLSIGAVSGGHPGDKHNIANSEVGSFFHEVTLVGHLSNEFFGVVVELVMEVEIDASANVENYVS